MQMISEHAGMLELFDRQRNHTDPAQISVKTNNKYWFMIEGHCLLVSPRTVLRHFELGTPWNFGRLGQTDAHDDYNLKTAIVPKTVKSDSVSGNTTGKMITTYDKLWLFSGKNTEAVQMKMTGARTREKLTADSRNLALRIRRMKRMSHIAKPERLPQAGCVPSTA